MEPSYTAWADSLAAAIRAARPATVGELDCVLATWRGTLDVPVVQGGPAAEPEPESQPVGWPCLTCTLVNAYENNTCRVCETPRQPPTDVSAVQTSSGPQQDEVRLYVVLRASGGAALGMHTASWAEMRQRLALGPNGLCGSGARIKRVQSREAAEDCWLAAGKSRPMPVIGDAQSGALP